MRALVQRVREASVRVVEAGAGAAPVAAIGTGLCVLVGVTHTDDDGVAHRLARKVAHLRCFDDAAGVMNRSLVEVGGEALVVSQFTLYGDTARGRRPSWTAAAPGPVAEPLVEVFATALREAGVPTRTGRFGAHMLVSLVNDGPVTLLLEA